MPIKIGALVLALAMVLSLGATAWADEAGNVYKTDPDGTQNMASGGSITFHKSIIFFNENGSDVYEPNITYTYEVAPATNVTTGSIVTDAAGNVATVNKGVVGGVYFGTDAEKILFSSINTAVTTSAEGVEVEKSTTLSVDLSKFDHAGIYRYMITETTTEAAKNAVGIVQGDDYDATRYLDVYITNGGTVNATTNPNGLQLSAAVFFKTVEATPGSEGTDDITTTFEKTTGFEPGTDGTPGSIDYTSETKADTYTTYDFTVKKEVSGALADKSHNFPFYVSVTNTIDGAKYTYFDDPGTGAGAAEIITGTTIVKGTNSAASSLALKHGEYVKFVGVPSNTTSALSIDITEWNNTVDQYTPTVAATNGSPAMASGTKMDALTGTDSVSTFDLKANDAAGQILTVTNTIAEISPTGVVLRVAPYAIMLAAGLFLLFLGKKRSAYEA